MLRAKFAWADFISYFRLSARLNAAFHSATARVPLFHHIHHSLPGSAVRQ